MLQYWFDETITQTGTIMSVDAPHRIRHPASGIRHPASGIRHPASGIRHPASL